MPQFNDIKNAIENLNNSKIYVTILREIATCQSNNGVRIRKSLHIHNRAFN